MFLQIITQSLFYFLAIALVHYLYEYFKEMLTIPKVKDYIHIPKNEYNEIYKILSTNKNIENIGESKKNNKEELKNYFKNIHNNSKNSNTKETNETNQNNFKVMKQGFSQNKNEISYPSDVKSNGPIKQSFSNHPTKNIGENIQSFNISQEFNDSLTFSSY